MDLTQAQEEYLTKVYAPAFAEKMAALGVGLNSEEELKSAMEAIAVIKLAKAQEAKQQGNRFAEPAARLKEAMFGSESKLQVLDDGLLEATATLMGSAAQAQEQAPVAQPTA